jgi:hypothetical protein
MGDLLPDITDNTHENTMLEHVRRCDPLKRQPNLLELTSSLPTIQDVYHSYMKLRELCAPENDRKFMVSIVCIRKIHSEEISRKNWKNFFVVFISNVNANYEKLFSFSIYQAHHSSNFLVSSFVPNVIVNGECGISFQFFSSE